MQQDGKRNSNDGQQQPGSRHFSQQGGYPSQPDGYSGQQGGYPSQQEDYPRQQGGYPDQQVGYPGQQGVYPGQQGGHPGQQRGYPAQQGGYPGQQGGYPSQQGGYSGQQGYPAQLAYPVAPSGYPYQASEPGWMISGMSGSYGPSGPDMQGIPSLRPYQAFNPNADAETLRKAMKGLGCDKNKVITVLCGRVNSQRQQIAAAYKTMYGKDLINDLKSELSGDFEDLILALMEPPARYDAQQLHKAMQGLGTKESVLIEIMCSRTNAQIIELRNVYQQMYNSTLEKDLISETSGHFKRLLVSLCNGGRDESMQTDTLRANQDAKKLYKAGEQRLGTDESCFNAILASQNYMQLKLVFLEYQKITNHTIEKAIESEFSGDVKDGLLAVVACAQNKPAYFATLLYNSMVGFGTRDNDLIRVIVTRSEIDLADVRQAFERKYNKTLESFIKGDCSGAYKDGLIALVRGN
ncbi:annexin [Loa loa]|uniref:Annexin n=1 Tax=Loa loa TaxID=7209 RepID=A0A1S0TXZ2_LOALO|nr:annexin [Loa loa]EFO21283.2 annexin [Loa loa]